MIKSKIESPQDTFFLKNNSNNFKRMLINLDKPAIMGILNVTPDSFFDGGRYLNEEDIIERVNSMEYDGAKIIDIGGYSSRPKATHVTEEDELLRILPIIKLIRSSFPEILISIDTFRSKVAEKSINAGANYINDISGGNMDDNMFNCIADLQVPYILMHMQGTPQTMQDNPSYHNVVEEIKQFFNEKINKLTQLGVQNIILDPGFGFGKTTEHNYKLLNNLNEFTTFNLPILVGVSRKSMINKVINTTPEEALNGTTVLNTIALTKGANILRVHDIKEANETIKLLNQLKK
jgi:dihydropteroate synthase